MSTSLLVPVLQHGDLDPETSKLIIELLLQDIAAISETYKGKARADAPLSDEELALKMQRELWEDSIMTANDFTMAKSLNDAIESESDHHLLRATLIANQAAEDDRRAAEALENTGQLPPLTEVQRLVASPSFLSFVEPALKELASSSSREAQRTLSDFTSSQKALTRKGRPTEATPPPHTRWAVCTDCGHPLQSTAHASTCISGILDSPQFLYALSENPRIERNPETVRGMKPRYLRYNYWGEIGSFSPILADWSETAKPLPDPPQAELDNPVVLNTLAQLPSLFKIVTPIDVDVFEDLLEYHPNPAFVESVCKGLRQGFWPFADTHPGEYPDTFDTSSTMPRDPRKAQFLRDQRGIEISKERFSESFGTRLYDGMYSSPIHVVPKAGSDAFRLVTDHSSGEFSLNSMISHSDIAGMPMDDMRHFGEQLLAIHGRSSQSLTLWKSDVAEAYRLCPMHPHWQIKQVNVIDGEHHIDRNNPFGGRASFKLWGSVNSLVTWIAKNVYDIEHPLCFNDDSYGVCSTDDVEYYQPYGRTMPRDQWKLLSLWDHLGIPHKEKKQLSGCPLTIIGIEVDPNEMTLTLPADTRTELVAELHRFTHQPEGVPCSFQRKEFEKLTGWMNWAFNVFPLLRPSLSNVYAGIAETVSTPDAKMYCNDAMRDDLNWALNHIQSSEGIRILDSRAWSPDETDTIVLYTDSCLRSMAFWYPASKLSFYSDVPPNTPSTQIFYYEALCVASAFLHAASHSATRSKIVIYTDNSNTVDLFDSFHAQPAYNPLLRAVADNMIAYKHQLKVLHVPGEENIVADLLSRGDFAEAKRIHPSLSIKPFQPLKVS